MMSLYLEIHIHWSMMSIDLTCLIEVVDKRLIAIVDDIQVGSLGRYQGSQGSQSTDTLSLTFQLANSQLSHNITLVRSSG